MSTHNFSATAGKTITCKAAVSWGANQPQKVEEIQVEPPRKHEVRIKMFACSVCHTDCVHNTGLKTWCNQATFPIVYGHEGAGIVESVGEGVTCVKPVSRRSRYPVFHGTMSEMQMVHKWENESMLGECVSEKNFLVNFYSEHFSYGFLDDGTSRFSKNGMPIHQFMTVSTFSEYTVVMDWHAAKANKTTSPTDLAPLGCCVPTGFGAGSMETKPGNTVAIWGLGAVGLSTILGAKRSGASQIVAIDVQSNKFDLAKKFGATECFNPNDFKTQEDGRKFPEILREKFDGGFDVTIECAGSEIAYEQAFQSANEVWGTLISVGIAPTPIPISTMDLIMGRKLVGTALGGNATIDGISRLSEMYAAGELPELLELQTQRLPFNEENINRAFEMIDRAEGFALFFRKCNTYRG